MLCRGKWWPGRAVFIATTCVIASAVMSGGCGWWFTDGRLATLAGRITIDGQPVKTGGIQFVPLKKGKPVFSGVRDGAYTAQVRSGRVRVIFSSYRETGRQVQLDKSKVPEVVDDLPPALREGLEISIGGDDAALDFHLSSTGGRR